MADNAPQEAPAVAAAINGDDVDMVDPTAELNGSVKQEPNDAAPASYTVAGDVTSSAAQEPSVQPNSLGAAPAAAPSSLPPMTAARTSTPGGTRASTPSITNNAAHASSGTTALPPSAIIPPAHPHGSPTRVYLNQRVTPTLLEGMKQIATQEPERPLQWLGEFLLRKSKELESN